MSPASATLWLRALRSGLVVLCLVLALPHDGRAEVKIDRVESPGGIVAWLVQDKTVPVTAMEFIFANAGSVRDPDGKEGRAKLVASLIDEGAGDLDSKAFQGALSEKSIKLSYSAGLDSFSGSFYALNRYRDEAIELLRLSLTEPRFDEEPVSRIRRQILAGLRQDETDPGSIAGRSLSKTVFGNHHYARPSGGTISGIEAVTVDDLRNFMATMLGKSTLYIGVVGDISPEELAPILDQAFGGLPERGPDDLVPEFEDAPPAGTIVIDQEVPQSTILFAQRGLKLDDPDYFAGMVLNHVLGGGSFSSELVKEVRVQRGLAYSVYSFLHPMIHAALLRGGAGTQNARVGETVDVIRDVVRRLKEEGLTSEAIADAKTYLTGSYPLRFTSSSRIADQLVAMQYYNFGIDYIDKRNSYIEAVTDEQVNGLASRLLDPDGLLFVIVGRPEGIVSTLPVPEIGG